MATQEPSDHDSDVAWQIARCCYNDDYLTAHLQISEILTEEYGTLAADVERLRADVERLRKLIRVIAPYYTLKHSAEMSVLREIEAALTAQEPRDG